MSREAREHKDAHEHHRLGEFVAYLRVQGRAVGEPEWGDRPDGWVQLDGERTALELTCAYASPAEPLWNLPLPTPTSPNFSSSGDDELAAARRIDAQRVPALAAELQRLFEKKCPHPYRGRAYLVLDGSHDALDEGIPLTALLTALSVPADCNFTGVYLVEPRFTTPRQFVLLRGVGLTRYGDDR